ncbi:MAG TPA: septal ring lytic transglycosylase RlpA family protein [Terriglobales bacterium]|nr:septal ring lytic transglycosylase RlpA family protein [Terriglobales bacterium]
MVFPFTVQRLFTQLALSVILASLPKPVSAPATPATVVPTPHPVAVAVTKPPYQVGMATWYGKWFQGKETTSGEPFNIYAMTAAHKHLPFGTWVRVTNLLNLRTIDVRINDRGPVPAGRIIDLSYGAARALHFYEDGLIPVRIDIIPKPVRKAQLPVRKVKLVVALKGCKSASKN